MNLPMIRTTLICSAAVLLASCQSAQRQMKNSPLPPVPPAPIVAAAPAETSLQPGKNQNYPVQPAAHYKPAKAPPVHYAAVRSHPVPPAHGMLPQSAWTGNPGHAYSSPAYPSPGAYPPGCVQCGPPVMIPGVPPEHQPWAPPNISRPWPEDEYICDGGDRRVEVSVLPDFTVRGLDLEDTVAHYDTLDGRVEVRPSNRVCIYAPRFAAVRKVYGVNGYDTIERMAGTELPVGPHLSEETQIAALANQPLQPGRYLVSDGPITYRDRNLGIGMENTQGLIGVHNGFLPYEDFQVIRTGAFDNHEKARLAQNVENAIVWTGDQSVQVTVKDQMLVEVAGTQKPQVVLRYEHEGKPALRIVKVASRREAQPGDEIEFTLRFDNIGNEMIGNVTIMDNLTPRLEYIEGSESCTLDANFFTIENEAESVVVRWEIIDPLPAGQGGIIRFKCRLR